MDFESRVRVAAQELHDAIMAATQAGFRVLFPHQVEELPRIAVSAGRAAMTPDEIGAAAKAAAEREQKAAAPLPEADKGSRRPAAE